MPFQSFLKSISAVLLLLIVAAFFSCGKKWKETTQVSFRFFISPQPKSGSFDFTSGNMIVGEIDFSGDRKKGGPVNFSNVLSTPSTVNLMNGGSQPDIHYDIPQGVYKNINVSIKAVVTDSSPSISLNGTYVKQEEDDGSIVEETFPILFELNASDIYNVKVLSLNGSEEVVLIEGTPATCSVMFNPYYWFDVITEEQIEQAVKYNIEGVSTVQINKTKNPTLYSLIIARMNQSTTANIK